MPWFREGNWSVVVSDDDEVLVELDVPRVDRLGLTDGRLRGKFGYSPPNFWSESARWWEEVGRPAGLAAYAVSYDDIDGMTSGAKRIRALFNDEWGLPPNQSDPVVLELLSLIREFGPLRFDDLLSPPRFLPSSARKRPSIPPSIPLERYASDLFHFIEARARRKAKRTADGADLAWQSLNAVRPRFPEDIRVSLDFMPEGGLTFKPEPKTLWGRLWLDTALVLARRSRSVCPCGVGFTPSPNPGRPWKYCPDHRNGAYAQKMWRQRNTLKG